MTGVQTWLFRSIAFSGGMDLTQGRWDSARHIPDNCHRQEPDAPYGPVHDVQSLFDGDAARAMTELVAERWRLVTGETLEPVVTRSNPWPLRVLPRLRDIRVAIARSQPPFGEQPEVREVEALNMDMLRAAKRLIYIEQQYYTINAVNELLCEHLQREDGPEIVIVMNDISSGWIEQKTMFGNRDSLFTLLRRADRFGRLRTVTPICRPNPLVKIKVHSKVTMSMIAIFGSDRPTSTIAPWASIPNVTLRSAMAQKLSKPSECFCIACWANIWERGRAASRARSGATGP